jgi:DNA-binding XRE family transcriptional regulator
MAVRTFLPYSKTVKKPLSKAVPLTLLSLGDHIRKVRIEREMLQKDVACIIGVSVDCLTNWENNRAQPQINYYPAIIAYLGYDPFATPAATFGQKVYQYRRRHGLNIERMGALAGVNASTILSWESGVHMPAPDKQLLIETILNTKPLI